MSHNAEVKMANVDLLVEYKTKGYGVGDRFVLRDYRTNGDRFILTVDGEASAEIAILYYLLGKGHAMEFAAMRTDELMYDAIQRTR